MRFEPVPELLEFFPQFQVVVNLAVEGDPGIAVFGKNRLIARSEIDDFQSRCAHREKARLKYALLVRPAMDQRRRCLPDSLGRRGPVLMRISDDSAQIFCLAEPRLKFRVPLFFVQATSGDCHSAVLDAAQRPIARRAAPLEPAETGRIARDLAGPNGWMELISNSIVAGALAVAQRANAP